MATPNSLRASNDEILENSIIANSFDDIKKFLSEKNLKPMIIEKVAQSFMAKIPAGTRVELKDNILKVGESIIKLGEDIFQSDVSTKAIMEQTNSRAMAIVNHNLPVKQAKNLPAVANGKKYQMVA